MAGFAGPGRGGLSTTSGYEGNTLTQISQLMGGGGRGGRGMPGGMNEYMSMAQSLLEERRRAAREAADRRAEQHEMEMREREAAEKRAGREEDAKRRRRRTLESRLGRARTGVLGTTSSGPDPYGIGKMREEQKREAFKEKQASDAAMYEALLQGTY